jgi:hypothetical protein
MFHKDAGLADARKEVGMARDLAYEQDVQVELLPAQLDAWTIQGPERGPLTASGPCPACTHTTTEEVAIEIMGDAQAAEADLLPPPERTTRRFLCRCTAPHAGRPDAVIGGCGRWWLVTLLPDGTDGWLMTPGGDGSLLPALQALDAAATGERTAVRSAAEKWLPGITVLYGLFGLAGVALSRDAVDSLVGWAKVLVAFVAVAGLVATVMAVIWGYRAAFGWVEPVDVSNDQELREWYESRRNAVTDSVKNLRGAVFAAVTAVVFLVIAAGFVMYAPAADPVGPKARVTYSEGGDAANPASTCGLLVDPSPDQGVAVKVKDGDATRIQRVDIAWVTAVIPVKTCP